MKGINYFEKVGVSSSGKGKAVVDGSEEDIVEESEYDLMEEDSDKESTPLESRTGKCEKRRKRKTPEEMEADAKLDWVESIPLRGFKSERQVSRRSFAQDNDILILLDNQGLRFWTRSLRSYNEAGVIAFYQNLNISEALAKGKIKSKVNNKNIVVDAGVIAKYLSYERPAGDLVNYPHADLVDTNAINHDMYTAIPCVEVPPHKPGWFKDLYRGNLVLHYNLYPHEAENKLSRKSAEIMYAFMNGAAFKAD
ncbi:hypothetical protein RHMOL_Rhmol10G0131400 [Rhododendron molle]|uniref:Uncharacterized protein n=1 Tax=Rhododendron molle TaxID=49168 RepID=A0ACC0M2V9_RHOML|nr:hypothetical protein RHMOL_Rhmol10G0131400 [Rhododendron molle]